jgi:hypothetical protein
LRKEKNQISIGLSSIGTNANPNPPRANIAASGQVKKKGSGSL